MDLEEAKMHESHAHVDDKYLKFIEIGTTEKVICAIRKHPIGLVSIYLSGIFVFLVIVTATTLVGSWIQQQLELSFRLDLLIMLAGLVLGIATLFFTYVSGFIYQNNILILTNEKVAQILYSSLINRKISQLSLGELQDITVDQTGLLSRIFQFGTLVLETAGEQNNYNFSYTRFPHHCAKEMVQAHEASVKRYGN